MKGYMASGQFSRGKENIRADDSLIMLGYLDVDVEQQQKMSHLLSPMPSEMRDDTAFMDRIHAYAPYPKISAAEPLTSAWSAIS
jgi:ATP-dependent Lon protease